MNRAARTLGLVTELAAIGIGGLLELAFPDTERDRRIDAEAELADFEAENEVAEPAEIRAWSISSLLEWMQREGRTDVLVQCGRCLQSVGDFKAFACHMLTCDLGTTSQPSPDSTPAGDRSAGAGELPPTAPAEPFDITGLQPAFDVRKPAADLAEWLKPAICEALASHIFYEYAGGVECRHDMSVESFANWPDWAEHLADDLAPHIVRSIAAQPK